MAVFRGCCLPSRVPLFPGGPGVRCPVRWVRKRAIRPRIDRVEGVTKSVMAPAYHRLWVGGSFVYSAQPRKSKVQPLAGLKGNIFERTLTVPGN